MPLNPMGGLAAALTSILWRVFATIGPRLGPRLSIGTLQLSTRFVFPFSSLAS